MLNSKNSFIKGFPDKTQTGLYRITTGRQKQSRFRVFYQLKHYWLKNVIIPKEIPFLLLPPVSLVLFAFSSIF